MPETPRGAPSPAETADGFFRISQLFPGLVVDFRVHKAIHAFRIAKMKIRYFPASDVILTHKVSNKTDSVRSEGLCRRKIIA